MLTASTALSWPYGASRTLHKRMIFPAASNRCLVPPIRMKKVLAIRQQLAEGRYDFDLRLNTVVDRLLNTLNA